MDQATLELVDAVLAWRYRELNGKNPDDALLSVRDATDRYINRAVFFAGRYQTKLRDEIHRSYMNNHSVVDAGD